MAVTVSSLSIAVQGIADFLDGQFGEQRFHQPLVLVAWLAVHAAGGYEAEECKNQPEFFHCLQSWVLYHI